ncbi:MAG: UxaA family hydrolase [Lachnospiraceae bacterium]|jgi:altronate dehydratase small subunit|nr:UxaA family hydrolase [Lachnospiraceae bacterium]
MELKLALKIDDLDNVATIFAEGLEEGMVVEVRDKRGHSERIPLKAAIPYGHKLALCDLKEGDLIMKYGECIGTASAAIPKGDYVHVHNLKARRGRGDL